MLSCSQQRKLWNHGPPWRHQDLKTFQSAVTCFLPLSVSMFLCFFSSHLHHNHSTFTQPLIYFQEVVMSESLVETTSKRSEPKAMKRFNNGHKTFNWREQQFLKEIYNGERTSNEKFNDKISTRRRPRNPLLGEETPREGQGISPSTELYLPNQALIAPFSPKYSLRDTLDRNDSKAVDIAMTLRKRKNKIDDELKMIDQRIEYRTQIMNATKASSSFS